jgi:peptidylprolyl isomerase
MLTPIRILKKYLQPLLLSLLLLFSSASLPLQPALAGLAPGNAITDGRALLRYALPIQSPDLRDVQSEIEAISESLRGKRWSPIRKNIDQAYRILQLRAGRIIDDTPAQNKSSVSDRLEALKEQLQSLEAAVKAENKEQTLTERRKTLTEIGTIEALMVDGFPFEIPAEYDHLPRLLGRATVQFTTELGEITAILDGYSAPLTAGNFVDLVQKGFYDGLPITRAEEFYVLQLGDPPGPATGFIDPATGKERTIPLEVLVEGDDEPIYGFTLEELGLYQENPVLPFAAFGTLGMARPSDNENGASSQFFFYLFEPELAPAGFNLLDGRYAAFGYVIEGSEILYKLQKGDLILKAEVISGGENLVQGS